MNNSQPILNGSNYTEWKERMLILLGCIDLDLVLRVDKPPVLTEGATLEEKAFYDKWDCSNRLSLLLMSAHVGRNVKGSIPECQTAHEFMEAVDQQFASSNKALASTLMAKLSSMRYSGSGSIREQIMEMRDIASQLNAIEITISDFFLVQLILNSLPHEFGPFKISYNTHKDIWSVNELLTMCVQEEGSDSQL
ncbi:uncharacterized protein LOC103714250 [Phoenix dactylifera]|uniref:Uncharacterized protein LOC103714250 n=1 Tax=Phoenix dactylifera TaxID=42345 RepID=A0A8B7CHY1_PHODC|nr:uncharacterized protein LOC103714250 [Phoenix dactylifera]